MNEPVDLDHPALLPADLDLVQQVTLRLLLAAAHRQRLPDVLDVLLAGQLRHAWGGGEQHGSQTGRFWRREEEFFLKSEASPVISIMEKRMMSRLV